MLLSLSPVLPRGAPVGDLAAHYQASSNNKEHAPAYEDEVGRHGGRKEEEEEEGAAGGATAGSSGCVWPVLDIHLLLAITEAKLQLLLLL